MSMPRPVTLLLALTLGAGSATLVACGGSDNPHLLSAGRADRIDQALDEVGLFHASPRDPVWEYVLSTLLADLCLDAQRHRICLVGHSHVALAFARSLGNPVAGELRMAGSKADLGNGEWLLNPGSVGQPRDGDPRAAWLLLDLEAWTAEWRRVEYDVEGAQSAILAAGLPESLAERLEYGQ